MNNYLGRMILLVSDYEEASNFYENNFGFKRIYDVTTEAGQRFLHIGSDSKDNAGIWFLKAESKEQEERIGNQTAGQPTLVIYTTSLELLNKKLNENKVRIKVPPILTSEYKFLHCFDLYGNEIVVVELGK
jgi:hypothetical protein